MASISNQPGGRRTIQFVDPRDGRRRSIRLGKVTRKVAETFKTRVEYLLAARKTGQPIDSETAEWLSKLDEELIDRLASVGLAASRGRTTLERFLEDYVKARSDVKPSTKLVYGHTKRNLVQFFGPSKLLRDITRGDADDWRLWLAEQRLADNTVRRRSGIAKQFFKAAVRKDLIGSNPFEDLTCVVRSNPDRFYFVTREEADRVLAACPNEEWRAIFALCRFGGLRCPSEVLLLRWDAIDWERGRMTILSPKTEHHVDGASREIPLFPEMRGVLKAGAEKRDPACPFVIARYRDSTTNLRTTMMKIIRRAGLEPWPKLFQNLRSTRETELADQYPLQVVCAWIGNSQAVAARHYLQVTDAHFDAAASSDKAVQNPVQYGAVSARTQSHR